MTRVYISLLLLVLCGIGFLVAPDALMGLKPIAHGGPLKLWQHSIGSFAVPFSLLLLAFTRHPFVQGGTLIWGAWMGILTLVVLGNPRAHAENANFYGILFLLTVLVISLTLVLSTVYFLFKSGQTLPLSDKPENKDPNPPLPNKPL